MPKDNLATSKTPIMPTLLAGMGDSAVGTTQDAYVLKVLAMTLETQEKEALAYSIREDAKANTFSATPIDISGTISAHQPSIQSHHAQVFPIKPRIRRLMPEECEALQGFPVGWTNNGQIDRHRFKQMGNAVAVPVVSWVIKGIVDVHNQ
jgi:site-specific DNA-cytosine methylase